MEHASDTRARLQTTAVRLFTERGFQGVTVDEIARAAGVSHMTFFRYFPTKASVLLWDPYDPVISRAVAETDRALSPLERVVVGLHQSWGGLPEPSDDLTRDRLRLITGDEGLIAEAWSNNRRTEAAIVDALTDTGVERLDASIAAGAVMGAMMAALVDWGDDPTGGPLGDRVRYALDQLASVDGGPEGRRGVVAHA